MLKHPSSRPRLPAAGRGVDPALGDGGAAGLGDLLSGVQAAARRIANFATYYQMKSRAGTVGSKGVADLLQRVRTPSRPFAFISSGTASGDAW